MGAKLNDFQIQKLDRVFTRFFDTNRDGIIEWQDFELAVQKMAGFLGWASGSSQYDTAMKTMHLVWEGLRTSADKDEDGKISHLEWCSMWSQFAGAHKQKAVQPGWQKAYMDFMFQVNDTSGDGAIDLDEYTAVYTHYDMSQEDCSKAWAKFGKEGGITNQEFEKLWLEYFTCENDTAKGNYIFGCF